MCDTVLPMVKLFQAPDNLEDRQQLLLDTIERYCTANSYSVVGKLQLFASITKMADRGDGHACYVVGACYIGEGPCGDGLLGINRDKASHYLGRAHELGDPLAQAVLKKHDLADENP